MNFPPVLFYNQNFSTLFTNNYSNHNSYSLIPYQNLCKKLLKFENNDQDFHSNVINWIKSLKVEQLIKYISLKNQWFVDVLHEMILLSGARQELKYKFITSSNSETENKEPKDSKIITYINFLLIAQLLMILSSLLHLIENYGLYFHTLIIFYKEFGKELKMRNSDCCNYSIIMLKNSDCKIKPEENSFFLN